MSDYLQERMGKLLDQYDEARSAARARKDQVIADEALFFQKFAELRRSIVRPVFEAAGAMLKERGHSFSIVEEEFAAQADGKSTEAAIELRVFPAGVEKPPASDDHLCALSFTTRHYNKMISVRNGSAPHEGTAAGAKGAHLPARIDTQLVEEEVLKLMAGLVRV
jgi:hypothetical protein